MVFFRSEMIIVALAVIGALTLATAGGIGIAKLLHYRAGDASSDPLVAGITIPETVAPLAPPALPRTLSRPGPPAPSQVSPGKLGGAILPAPEPMADLSIRIIDTGISGGGGSGFVRVNSIPAGERPAIVFVVMNVGTVASDRWQFSANLPTLDGRHISSVQLPLGPGEGRRFTLGFGELNKTGENPVTLSVFSWSSSSDKNPANDADTAILERGY